MKTIYTLLLCLLPGAVFSQHFFLGVQGGLQKNTEPFGAADHIDNYESKTMFAYGIKAGIDMRKIQFGAGVIFSMLDASHSVEYYNSGNSYVVYTYKINMTNPYAFINLKHHIQRSEIYYGINIGYLYMPPGAGSFTWVARPLYPSTRTAPAVSAMSAGVQAGYRFNIVKNIGVSIEAGARYHSKAFALPAYDTHAQSLRMYEGNGFLSFPVMVGIDNRF